MSLPNPGMDAVPFTPLTAEFLDDIIENIESLSSGTGQESKALDLSKINGGGNAGILQTDSGGNVSTAYSSEAYSIRTKPRAYSTTTGSSITPNINDYNVYEWTALNSDITVNAPTGAINNKDIVIFFFRDNGTARNISFNANFVNISGVDSLTRTTANKWHTVGAMYNSTLAKWQIVSITNET